MEFTTSRKRKHSPVSICRRSMKPCIWHFVPKYEEFVKSDDEVMAELKEAIVSSEYCEVPISLGVQKTSIRFVETHYHDLKAIVDAME